MDDKQPKIGRPKVREVPLKNLGMKVEPELFSRFSTFARSRKVTFPAALTELLDASEGGTSVTQGSHAGNG